MDIITEKFYYSDDREYWDKHLKDARASLILQSEALQEIPEEDRLQIMQELGLMETPQPECFAIKNGDKKVELEHSGTFVRLRKG